MKIKYYLETEIGWENNYWIDFNTNTPRDNSITRELSEEELHELIKADMCEIEEIVRKVLREL